MFEKIKKKSIIQKSIKEKGYFTEFFSEDLQNNFEFVASNMPSEYLKGVVFLEKNSKINLPDFPTIIFHSKDNAYSIRKKIAFLLLENKKIPRFESCAQKLITDDLIQIHFLEKSYNNDNPIFIFKELVTDIFSFFWYEENLNLKEVSEVINSIYIKQHVKKNFSKQSDIDSIFDI